MPVQTQSNNVLVRLTQIFISQKQQFPKTEEVLNLEKNPHLPCSECFMATVKVKNLQSDEETTAQNHTCVNSV